MKINIQMKPPHKVDPSYLCQKLSERESIPVIRSLDFNHLETVPITEIFGLAEGFSFNQGNIHFSLEIYLERFYELFPEISYEKVSVQEALDHKITYAAIGKDFKDIDYILALFPA